MAAVLVECRSSSGRISQPAPPRLMARVGENRLDPQHGEFRTPVRYTEVKRSGILDLNGA